MEFKLTRTKEIEKEKPDYELLEDQLKDYADSVNYTWRGWCYTNRVFFCTTEGAFSGGVRVWVSFKSEHKRKNPQKYGEDFRKECIHTIVDFANETLNEDRKSFLITVKEDFDSIEERFYERQ